jgi:hypothetical protein
MSRDIEARREVGVAKRSRCDGRGLSDRWRQTLVGEERIWMKTCRNSCVRRAKT